MAMRQIPRSAERISSCKLLQSDTCVAMFLYKCRMTVQCWHIVRPSGLLAYWAKSRHTHTHTHTHTHKHTLLLLCGTFTAFLFLCACFCSS